MKRRKIAFQDILAEGALPRPETEILVSFLLKKEREFLLTHPETMVSRAVYKKFLSLAAKRLQDWPIAYLTGAKEFYGLSFQVTPAVLVPRPETELMVEETLSKAEGQDLIVDIGTGSGTVIVAVAAEMKKESPKIYRTAAFAAADISPAALKVAKGNATAHKLHKIRFYRGNLLTPLKLDKNKLRRRRLIIAANLPYLTPAQAQGSPSIKREPRLALVGGTDGLKYYRQLFRQIQELNSPGTEIQIFCEINPGQKNSGLKLAKRYFPAAAITVKKDLAKKHRLLAINLKK